MNLCGDCGHLLGPHTCTGSVLLRMIWTCSVLLRMICTGSVLLRMICAGSVLIGRTRAGSVLLHIAVVAPTYTEIHTQKLPLHERMIG